MTSLLKYNNNLYEDFVKNNSEINLHNMNGLIIPFSNEWKNIGINLSGGADSASLTILLCDIISKNNIDCKIHIITHCRGWTIKPWQLPISIKVYNKLKELWPNIIEKRFENYIPPEIEYASSGMPFKDHKGEYHSGDQIEIDSFNKYIVYREKLNATFNATTLNPSSKDFISRLVTEQPPKRSRSIKDGNIDDLIFKKNNYYECTPFVFTEKDVVIKYFYLYDKLNLLNITRSCEGNIFHLNIKFEDYVDDMDIPICNHCFWCKERNWAIEKIKNV